MSNLQELSEILDYIWDFVHRGAVFRDNAMTTPAFITAGPDARTISLRDASREARSLYFHGDRRAKKVRQIQENPRSIWLAWDQKNNQQFHFIGNTSIHTDDGIADRIWENESPDELVFYFKKDPPGTPTSAPTSGVDLENISEAEARANFAAFRTVIDEIVWHRLLPDLEMRASFRWDGQAYQGEWLIP